MRADRPRLDWVNLTLWSVLPALCVVIWVLAFIGLHAVLKGQC